MEYGIEVNLLKDKSIIKETIERMGVANKQTKTLYVSAYLIEKDNKFFICHFKEIYAMKNNDSTLSNEDINRRNSICQLLKKWNLIETITDINTKQMFIGVVPYVMMKDWKIVHKIDINKEVKTSDCAKHNPLR